ncbi:Wzz/FepE/Etk N-terminal domain-containing protein [uncultured Polaribacter sp.]|uniref:Wzz/FepE/Etk N-terminal domain-containing protein n=1 Tax=uncultured Polaribacter sp. TaxID=174711 RepID=UPI002627A718|nr:Wzz/FepE/Etk N-terminal domain-containing protein [uncultured Polaribacter sp.]
MVKEIDKHNYKEDEFIDIIALLKNFWKSRKLILKIILFFFILGLFVAIFSKKSYTSSSVFVPLIEGKSPVSGLGGLASLAGINIGGGVTNSEISPELYPKIVNSIPFQLELLETKLSIEGQDSLISYRTFYENVYEAGVLANLKKYTIGLPGVLISFFKADEVDSEFSKRTKGEQIMSISSEEHNLINILNDQLDLEVNAKEGFVAVSFSFPEAKASAQLALKAQELLQKYALQFKAQKAIEQLSYIKDRYAEKSKEFNKAKIALARFQDRNRNINTAMGRTTLLSLQSEYNLIFSVYSELAKQLETQQLQVKKDTPLFTVLKPVTIPLQKSAPKRGLILFAFTFVGIVLGFGFVLGKEYINKFKIAWKLKS